MTKCEGCEQEKEVTDIEGNILCEECAKDIVRCDFCNRLLARVMMIWKPIISED